jgi:hypothetical protein
VFGFVECIDLLAAMWWCASTIELATGNTTLIRDCVATGERVSVATSNTARAGRGRFAAQVFCVKSTLWQAFSRRSGSKGRTTGIAIFRRHPNL